MHLLKIRLCLIFVLLESRLPTCFAITYCIYLLTLLIRAKRSRGSSCFCIIVIMYFFRHFIPDCPVLSDYGFKI